MSRRSLREVPADDPGKKKDIQEKGRFKGEVIPEMPSEKGTKSESGILKEKTAGGKYQGGEELDDFILGGVNE